jgi:CRISPR type IV-associated protein Csf3
MQPLKVTIKLSTPMVEPDSLLHLDGLLGALKVKQVKADHGEGIDPRQHHYDLP